MKHISKMNAFISLFAFCGLIIFICHTSLWAVKIPIPGLPKPGEMVLTSEKDIPRHLFVARQYLKAGKFREVISICEQVLNMKQDHVEAHAHMAAAHKGLGEEEKYKNEVSLIKKLAPKSPALYLSLAATYLSLKDIKNAENSYKNGIKITADKIELRMGLGALYQKTGRLKKASDQYRAILKKKILAPKYFLNANFALCQIGMQQKDYDQVIKRARMVTELYPPIPQGYLFLGAAHRGKGETEEAIKVYKKLMKVHPKSPVSYQELALIYIDKLGDTQKALHYAQEAARKFPKDAKSQDVLGWVYYNEEEYPEALKQFQAAVRLANKSPQYYYHLGLTHQKIGDKDRAKEIFQQALGLINPKQSKKFATELKDRIDQCR